MTIPAQKPGDALAGKMERAARRGEPEALRPVTAEMHVSVEDRPSDGALRAIIQNSLTDAGDSPLAPNIHVRVAPVGRSLSRDGCDYIESVNLLLKALDFDDDEVKQGKRRLTAACRHLVLVICGLTGGDSEQFFSFTQDQISKRMNVARVRVSELLAELYDWEKARNVSVLEVSEREYDPAIKKYKPSQYRAVIVPYAAEFVKRARAGLGPKQNPQYAIPNAIEAGHRDIAEGIAGEMPLAPLYKKRSARGGPAPMDFDAIQQLKRKQAFKLLEDCRDIEYTQGYDLESYEQRLHDDIHRLMSAQPMKYVR